MNMIRLTYFINTANERAAAPVFNSFIGRGCEGYSVNMSTVRRAAFEIQNEAKNSTVVHVINQGWVNFFRNGQKKNVGGP